MQNLRAVMKRHGPAALLELEAADVPTPAHGEVRIAVQSAGVSPADLLICQGLHPEARRAPFTPGWDVIGRVDAVGPGVERRLGERVAALTIVGGFARFVCVADAHLVSVPDDLDAAQAQCLPFDYLVAYQLLHRVGHLPRGSAALVQGAAGSIGGALLELGAHEGLRLYGTASTRKLAAVRARGATAIDYTRDDFVTVMQQLEPGGVAASFDGVGSTLWRSARCARRGGLVVGFGHASSVMGGRRDWARFTQILGQYAAVFVAAALGRWRAHLYSVQQLRAAHPEWYREDLTALFGLLRSGAVTPRVARTLPLERAREALQLVSDGQVEGKLVLTMAGPT